jgi:tRNA pseudouridine32 synthase/23S rRNA pseudouridine746 synthase
VLARKNHLRPLAIAEFWWGAPPLGGARTQGNYYPACRDKCGPLLPFLLEGLPVAGVRRFRPDDLARTELDVVAETGRWVVIDKPAGLLSVPGTDPTVTDTVIDRLRRRHPRATGPLLVHRLDLETSGLLLAALDLDAYTDLQRQFARREVHKRYIAWLDGQVEADRGVIDLPLRVDLEQRPRQIVDRLHGKRARTRFEVLERREGRTRIAFYPETGRTHQLRVHAAHPEGLGIPIAGDRLYGRSGERLMLHAETLAFRDPLTQRRVELVSPAPF